MDAPRGSIIAYATAPGSVAADGGGRNGVFTKYLLKHMGTPGLTVEQVLKKVRTDVIDQTREKQIPWESSSLTGEFYFASKRGIAVTKRTTPQPPVAGVIKDYDSVIQEREASKRKWGQWLHGMGESFAKARRYDRSAELTSKEKMAVWESFLASYNTDNPFSIKDEDLRAKAEKRLRYWKFHKVASLSQKPKYSPPVQELGEVDRDSKYIAYANGIVKDTKTGFEWKVGPDKDMTWDEARSWVQSLNLDGGGWRMATMNELSGLYKRGAGKHNMTPFLKTTGWFVWSNETDGPTAAWAFSFRNGGGWDSIARNYSYFRRAFAVRSRSDG